MTLLKRLALPALTALGIALSGCIKSEQTFTIYPDGAGKVEIKQTLMGMMAQMMKAGGQMGGQPGQEGMQADPFEMLKKGVEGKVYWTDLKTADGPAGEYVISGTGYFENINDVKPEKGSLSFKKNEDGGYTFSMTQDLDELKQGMPGMEGAPEGQTLTPEQEAQQQQMMAMMKGMLAGFEMKVSVVMPGEIKSAEGMKPDQGRRALFQMGEQDVIAMMEKKKEPPKEMKVVSGPASGLDAEMEQFKKSLAAAKEADAKAQSGGAKPAPGAPAGEGEGMGGGEGKKDF